MLERPVAKEERSATWLFGLRARIGFALLMVAIALGAEALMEASDGAYVTAAVLAAFALAMVAAWRAWR